MKVDSWWVEYECQNCYKTWEYPKYWNSDTVMEPEEWDKRYCDNCKSGENIKSWNIPYSTDI